MTRLCPALLAAFTVSLAGSLIHIPTDSRLYDDFDLLRTAGLFHSLPPSSRPWTKAEAVRLLTEAESIARHRHPNLAVQSALERLLAEFGDELPHPSSGWSRRPILVLPVPAGPNEAARFDIFSRGFASRQHQSISLGSVLDNQPADRFAFYNRSELTLFRPDSTVVNDSAGVHLPGTRLTPWRGLVTLATEEAYLAFKTPWLRVAFGRDEFYWGPGYTGSLMLDDDAPSLNNLQLAAVFPNFRFYSFSAFLSRWQTLPRFLSAQRLELSVADRVTFGGAMMAIASWDSLHPYELAGLINPLIPIYLTTATLGHGENFLIGWDVTVYLPQTKTYVQLFLDNFEFNTRRDAPNAYGLQLGAYWVPLVPVETRLEYTRVTPFTYYHRKHNLAYENWQVPLGHPLGPDADQLYGSLRLTVFSWLRLTLGGDYTRRGFYNRGDFLRRSFFFGESLPTEFPARGISVTGDTLGADWQVEQALRLLPSVEILLGYSLRLVGDMTIWTSRNYQGLPGSRRDGINFSLRLEYRYQ